MTLAECAEAVHKLKMAAVCYGDTPSFLSDAQAVFVILSSVAIIATAIFAWLQVLSLKAQMKEAKDSADAQLVSNRENQRLGAT